MSDWPEIDQNWSNRNRSNKSGAMPHIALQNTYIDGISPSSVSNSYSISGDIGVEVLVVTDCGLSCCDDNFISVCGLTADVVCMLDSEQILCFTGCGDTSMETWSTASDITRMLLLNTDCWSAAFNFWKVAHINEMWDMPVPVTVCSNNMRNQLQYWFKWDPVIYIVYDGLFSQ